MAKLINCTPHAVNVILSDGKVISFPPSGIVPRCSQTNKSLGTISLNGNEIPLTTTSFGDLVDLPDKVDGVFLIVSRLVANAANRDDLLVPNDLVRDDQNIIIGCKSLSR